MDLGTLRKNWIAENGRYDLVKTVGEDDFVNDGANLVINDAIRHMDQRVDNPDTLARYVEISFAIDSWFLKMAYAREITEVWATDASTGTRWQLKPVDMLRLKALYKMDYADVSSGAALYWVEAKGRLSPDNADTDFSGVKDVGDTFRGAQADAGYQGVIIMPPTDTELVVTVVGRFWSPTLLIDTDFNWWTVTHPRIVQWVASYLLEVGMRNRQGQADWLEPIERKLREIEFDVIEAESELIKGFVEA